MDDHQPDQYSVWMQMRPPKPDFDVMRLASDLEFRPHRAEAKAVYTANARAMHRAGLQADTFPFAMELVELWFDARTLFFWGPRPMVTPPSYMRKLPGEADYSPPADGSPGGQKFSDLRSANYNLFLYASMISRVSDVWFNEVESVPVLGVMRYAFCNGGVQALREAITEDSSPDGLEVFQIGDNDPEHAHVMPLVMFPFLPMGVVGVDPCAFMWRGVQTPPGVTSVVSAVPDFMVQIAPVNETHAMTFFSGSAFHTAMCARLMNYDMSVVHLSMILGQRASYRRDNHKGIEP